MELREVIGRRRSIRFVRPYVPVEPEKIQRMLEAARMASHWGNVQSLRALVVFKDSASEETVKAIQAPVVGLANPLSPRCHRLVHRNGCDRRAVRPAARTARCRCVGFRHTGTENTTRSRTN